MIISGVKLVSYELSNLDFFSQRHKDTKGLQSLIFPQRHEGHKENHKDFFPQRHVSS